MYNKDQCWKKTRLKNKTKQKNSPKGFTGFYCIFFLVILGFIGVFNIEVVEKALLKALLKAY